MRGALRPLAGRRPRANTRRPPALQRQHRGACAGSSWRDLPDESWSNERTGRSELPSSTAGGPGKFGEGRVSLRGTPEGGVKRAAFEAAALPFMRALYNTALRLTREPPDAADLVQETFLRAYRTFENFTPGSNCKAWLFTILYSIFTNQYHQAKRRPRMESVEELEGRFHQFAGAPEDPASDITLVEGWGGRWSPEGERALGRAPPPGSPTS